MLVVGNDIKYLMTKDRSYNDEDTVLRFYPLETMRHPSKVSIGVSRPRTLEEANIGYQGKKRYIVTDDAVEFFRLETIKEGGLGFNKYGSKNILVKYRVPYCDIDKYGIESIFSEAKEFF